MLQGIFTLLHNGYAIFIPPWTLHSAVQLGFAMTYSYVLTPRLCHRLVPFMHEGSTKWMRSLWQFADQGARSLLSMQAVPQQRQLPTVSPYDMCASTVSLLQVCMRVNFWTKSVLLITSVLLTLSLFCQLCVK